MKKWKKDRNRKCREDFMDEFKDISVTVLCSSAKEIRYLVSTGENFFEANALTAQLLISLKNADNQDEGIKNFITSIVLWFTENPVPRDEVS
jgi:hypothetical protein